MIIPALTELDLTAVLATLREQEGAGHTAETDAELPLARFADVARRLSNELYDVLIPGGRQDLDVAYRRAARLAAFGISTARRIRTEQRQRACNTEQGSTDQ